MDRNLCRLPRPDHRDVSVLLLLVQHTKPPLLLPVVQRADDDYDQDGDDDRDPLGPLDSCACAFLVVAVKCPVQAEGKRDGGRHAEQDEDPVLERNPGEREKGL